MSALIGWLQMWSCNFIRSWDPHVSTIHYHIVKPNVMTREEEEDEVVINALKNCKHNFYMCTL